MTREKLLHKTVENESDDVLCPECNEKMRKEDPPHIPMPDLPENVEWLPGILGRVSCDNADCPVHKEQKLVSWSYRTSVVTSQQVILAACEDQVFQHGTPDEEPDDDDEAVKASRSTASQAGR